MYQFILIIIYYFQTQNVRKITNLDAMIVILALEPYKKCTEVNFFWKIALYLGKISAKMYKFNSKGISHRKCQPQIILRIFLIFSRI